MVLPFAPGEADIIAEPLPHLVTPEPVASPGIMLTVAVMAVRVCASHVVDVL